MNARIGWAAGFCGLLFCAETTFLDHIIWRLGAQVPQTGELEATSVKMHKATIRIYHDARHPSRVILPVVER